MNSTEKSKSESVSIFGTIMDSVGFLFVMLFENIGCLLMILLIIFFIVLGVFAMQSDIKQDELRIQNKNICTEKYQNEFKPGSILVNGKKTYGQVQIGHYTNHPHDGLFGDFQFVYPAGSTDQRMSGASGEFNWVVNYTLNNTFYSLNVPAKVMLSDCNLYLYIQQFTATKQ